MTNASSGRRRRAWRSRAWLAYWAVMFVVMHVPVAGVPVPKISFLDKIIHCGMYSLLTLLGGWVYLSANRRSSWAILLLWAGVYAAYGGLDEWLQQFTGRTTSITDWCADITGVTLATVVLLLWRAARLKRGAQTSPARGDDSGGHAPPRNDSP